MSEEKEATNTQPEKETAKEDRSLAHKHGHEEEHHHEEPFNIKVFIKDSVSIIFGIICATIGLEGFIVPNHLLDGGVTGISLLFTSITKIDVSFFIFALNIPFILMGYKQVSKIFAIKTFMAIITLSIMLLLLHAVHFPVITNDKVLIPVFGGFLLGAGIGLAMRGGCVLDGTEVLALWLTRKASLQVGEIILILNVIIFAVAAVVNGLETALYSILAFMSASKTVDFLTNGLEEYTGVMIISEKSDKIRNEIIAKLGRGVTIYKGKRGLRGKKAQASGLNDRDIIYTVVTKLELTAVKKIVDAIDKSSFMTTQSISSVKGGMIKERKLH
ncbi:MAG: YitT family protein [Bacteroidia bacterium]